jgi:hypothetical protein
MDDSARGAFSEQERLTRTRRISCKRLLHRIQMGRERLMATRCQNFIAVDLTR